MTVGVEIGNMTSLTVLAAGDVVPVVSGDANYKYDLGAKLIASDASLVDVGNDILGLTADVAANTSAISVNTADIETLQGTVTSGRVGYATYAALAATTAAAGTLGEVETDAGTHTDPVVGGTKPNSGVFRYSTSPAGWEYLYPSDAVLAADAAADAIAAAADAVAAASAATGVLAKVGTRLPRLDLYQPDRWTSGTLRGVGGTVLTGAGYEQFGVSAPMAVDGGSIIQLGKSCRTIQFFSDTEALTANWISSIPDPAAYTDIAVPSNAQCMVANVDGAYQGNNSYETTGPDYDFKVFPYSVNTPQDRHFGRLIDKTDTNPLIGETLAVLGDSRIANSIYNSMRRVCIETGMTLAITGGTTYPDTVRAGRNLGKALYRSDDTTALTSADFTNVRQVFIAFGFNDIWNPDPGAPTSANILARLGTPDDVVGTLTPAGVAGVTTVSARLRTVIATLLSWNPRLKITVASAYYGYAPVTSYGYTNRQTEQWFIAYRDAVKAVADATSCLFFDWYAESGINQYNWTAYLDGGGVHMPDNPPDRLSATPNGYDLGMVSQLVQFYRNRAIPKVAMAGYERVLGAP